MEKILKYKLDHAFFWLALIIYFLVNQKHLIGIGGIQYYLTETFFKVILLAALTYSNLSLLFPKFLEKRKYFLYVVLLGLVISLYVYFRNYQDLYYFKYLLRVPGYHLNSSTLPNVANAILFVCFGIAVKLSKRYYLQQQQLNTIKIEKLDAELKYLKAQINPHSLFNSINSVFSLIDKTNSEARTVLAKFSELLRYQLYDSGMDKVDIEKELEYLKNFIQLQELRKGKDLVVSFNISEKVRGFKIAPLLIAPFVENAFKYVSCFDDKDNRIEIDLSVVNNEFMLCTTNTCEASVKEEAVNNGGIGLSNVKRRLELLYPGRYHLNIEQKDSFFSAILKLKLNEA